MIATYKSKLCLSYERAQTSDNPFHGNILLKNKGLAENDYKKLKDEISNRILLDCFIGFFDRDEPEIQKHINLCEYDCFSEVE